MHEIYCRPAEMIWPLINNYTFNWSLRKNEIHLWIVGLTQSLFQVQALTEILTLEERRRANRFRFENDKKRFIVGHGILRRILGNYLGIPPNLLIFSCNAHGKLYLRDDLNRQMIYFNISHSREIGLIAFTRDGEIGVDIEQVRCLTDIDLIVRFFFSEREKEVFRTLPPGQKTKAFFNCWVRKEAFLKAMGNGMASPLDAFEVSLAPGEPARLLSIAGDIDAASRWSMYEIMPVPGYVSAIVVQNQDSYLYNGELRNWHGEP